VVVRAELLHRWYRLPLKEAIYDVLLDSTRDAEGLLSKKWLHPQKRTPLGAALL